MEFRNVSFAYPGRGGAGAGPHQLHCVPGTITAIIGATGSGKSTLLNLLPRFLDATAGQILIGGRDVQDLPLAFPAAQPVALVPQHAYLFSGTLADNLRMGAPEATDENSGTSLPRPRRRLRPPPAAGAAAPVSQGGTNFSGGQRQRLCIARALLRTRPRVPFRRQLLGAGLRHGRPAARGPWNPCSRAATVLVVAERIATIVDAGLILVLENGRLVAQGTHRN